MALLRNCRSIVLTRAGALRLAAALFVCASLLASPSASAARAVRMSAAVARAASGINGLGPGDISAAYSLPATGAAGQTIAVVTAYNDPTAVSDLAQYMKTFKLPACGTASGCFRIVNQSGTSKPLPGPDPTGGSWTVETSLGTEIARGVCQSCKILLVEADGADNADLSKAVGTAARLGAQVIETSYSPGEQSGDTFTYAGDYTQRNSVVVAATGDSGHTFGVTFPAAFPNVIAVGGTSLTLNKAGFYGSETAWNSAGGSGGSGCSLYTNAGAWQAALAKAVGCGSMRATADIAAVSDPGALVYISNVNGTRGGGWYDYGGTSLSSPVIAGAIGLAGGGSGSSAQLLYERAKTDPKAFHDVTRGSTLGCVIKKPICAAGKGYDGPTGLGTPNGLAAFLPAGGVVDKRHPYVAFTSRRDRIHVTSAWAARLSYQNLNGFQVTASITLQRVSAAGRLQKPKFATGHLKLGGLQSGTASLTVAAAHRALLRQLGSVPVQATITLRGSTGASVTVTKRFVLYAP